MTLRVENLTGAAVRAAIPELARLRVAVFRDWPYLYDGSEDYERRYLATYAASEGGVIVSPDGGNHISYSRRRTIHASSEYDESKLRASRDDYRLVFGSGYTDASNSTAPTASSTQVAGDARSTPIVLGSIPSAHASAAPPAVAPSHAASPARRPGSTPCRETRSSWIMKLARVTTEQ